MIMLSKILGLAVVLNLAVFSNQLQSQGNSPVQQAKTLLQQGEIEQARLVLQKHLKEHPKDVAGLLLMGKMEKEGEISLGYFKDVQKSSDVDKRSQEANLQIANYYYIKGQYLTAIDLLLNFKKQFASSDFLPQAVWILGESYLAAEQIQEAQAEFEFLSANYPYTWASWGYLGEGDTYFASGEYEKAIGSYQTVIEKYSSSEAAGLAYTQISSAYSELGDETKASLYLNLYKEKYPLGLQNKAIFEPVTPIQKSNSKIRTGEAEKFLKVNYTVQLGVFGNKDYADNLIRELKSRGYEPTLSNKIINEKKYFVVQVGSFNSLEQAQVFKGRLEQELNQSFRVVIK